MILKMAFRNVFRQKRRSLLTALSMFGGFVLAAFSIAWADGSYSNIIDTFTRSRLGHIQIHKKSYLDTPSIYKTIDFPDKVGKMLCETDGVENWAPRIYSAGLAAVGKKSSGVRITGIHPVQENLTTGFAKKVVTGKYFSAPRAREALLGTGLAKILKAKAGDSLVLVSQGADGSIANEKYRITGIIASGNDTADRSTLFLPLKAAQDLLVLGERIHEIAVVTRRLRDIDGLTDRISSRLQDPLLEAVSWKTFARSFYKAMKADKDGMWVMLFIIVMVVAVGILNTVLMSVLERQREYGMLKAVGTRPQQIVRLVLAEVNILSLLCIAAGILVALLINSYFASHGIRISAAFSYGGMTFDTMKTEVNLRSFLIPAFTVLVSSSVVSFFPAMKAARTDPARSMRAH